MRMKLKSVAEDGSVTVNALYAWLSQCHGFLHNAILILPSLIFVLYLILQARRSWSKLSNGRSYVIVSYYSCLWLVSLLNLSWCSLQEWECTPSMEGGWNVLSLFTESGMLFLEVSLIAFLLQENHMGGLESLSRPFAFSALFVGLDILLKAFYLFGLGVPLFISSTDAKKWALLAAHKVVLTAIYGVILFMYCSTKWREKLPARPSFYKYVVIMFVLNCGELFACTLNGNDESFKSWLFQAATVGYHAFYLPMIYFVFLADFFNEDDFHLENPYFSELKDAGFFDADWD